MNRYIQDLKIFVNLIKDSKLRNLIKDILESLEKDYIENQHRRNQFCCEKIELEELIHDIRRYNINLQELSDLGLQRYNAKYGKIEDANKFFYEKHSTCISIRLYEALKRWGII